jgi:hypothetical protein
MAFMYQKMHRPMLYRKQPHEWLSSPHIGVISFQKDPAFLPALHQAQSGGRLRKG